MRTVLIRSDGHPMETYIIECTTGVLLDNVKRIEFTDLHVDMTKPWTAILHKYTDKVEGDEFVMEQEQVYVKVGEQL